MNIETLIEGLKVFLLVEIFFVWVPRYSNIVKEFKEYNLPDHLRDFVGILKLFFVLSMVFLILLSSIYYLPVA